MARHRNNPNMPFWKMIKEGYDHFEVSRQEPKVDFCEHKYVFDASKPPGATRDPVFDASAKCPAYVVADDLTSAVREKQAADEAEFNKLVAKGTPVARLHTGVDGGMNQVFAAHVPGGASTGLSDGGEGQGLSLASMSMAPGTIPSHVNPPAAPGPDDTSPSSRAAAVTAPEKAGLLASLRKAGTTGALAANATAATAKPESKSEPRPKAVASKPTEVKQAAARPPFKPSANSEAKTAAASAAPAPQQTALVSGGAPIMSTNSFDNRFSAVK
jgi:hypothetical protein